MELISLSGEYLDLLCFLTPFTLTNREAMQVAYFIRKTGKRQTTRFSGHIEIGSHLKVACKIFTKVSPHCVALCGVWDRLMCTCR